MPAAMPCKTPINSGGETHCGIGENKTKHACIVEADESTRIRFERALCRCHEDQIAETGINSQSQKLGHKFIPMPQALKIADAKSAVEKERENWKGYGHGSWRKSETRKTWSMKQRTKGRKVHFVSMMDLCHLKNSELEPQYQKYRGRVVLRGDIVKNDSGSYAVLLNKDHQHHRRQPQKSSTLNQDCQGAQDKQQTQHPLTPRSKWKMHRRCRKFQSQNVQTFGFVYTDTNGLSHGPVSKTHLFLLKGICSVILWQDSYRKSNLRKSYWNTVGKNSELGMLFVHREKMLFFSVYVDGTKLARKKQHIDPMWKKYSIKK